MTEEELATVVARYVEIQMLLDDLENERKALADRLRDHMAERAQTQLTGTVLGVTATVRRKVVTKVTYDEDVLAARLGSRYPSILSLDAKKLKEHAEEVRSWLGERIALVGSPDRDRVKALVESGGARPDEFAGAFRREQKDQISVSAQRPKVDKPW